MIHNVNNILSSKLRSLIMLLILFCGVNNAAWGDTWDGTEYTFKENDFANENLAVDGHDGKSWENAYVIKTARQLAYFGWIVKNKKTGYASAYYWKLGEDINLNSKSWTYGSNTGNSFQGHFDGGNHTISNVKFDVTTNSNYGFFPTIQGASTTSLAEVKNLKISGVTFTSGTPRANTTRLGALTGYARQADISNITISNVTFTYTTDAPITNSNQLGGAIGCIDNYTTVKNVTVNTVTATLSGINTATTATNDAVNLDVAGLIGYAKGDILTISGNTVSNVSITTSGRTNATRLAGLVGYVETNGTGGKLTIKNNTVSTVGITANGNVVGGTYLGGLVAYAKGKSSPDNRTLIQGNTVTNPTVAMNGETNSTFCMGGFLGYADTNTDVFNNKVTTPAISITNTINAETYIGGAVGRQGGYTTIDGMYVTDGSINGPSSNKNVNNNKNFFVGGFIGQQNSSGTTAYQPNLFKNIAVTGININLEKYQPATTITNHKFAVGGIAGCVNAPNKDANGFCGMPENIIFKGGKIYAPYATTSPTVSNFNASNPSQNTMTTEVVVTIDALDKAKTKTWYYSDYELGLSSDFLNSEAVIADNATTAKDKFHKNYTSSATITDRGGISYLTVNNLTFQKSNRHQDSERDSKTVLWWTNTAGYNAAGASADMFTNEEQPIYPHQAGASPTPAATSFPYYWYFFQGVSNANYVASDVATKIIEGIAGNKTEAAKEHPITLTISNPNENERGFAQRTISVVAKTTDNEGNVVDVTTGITGYQWYVNGVENGTGTSINLTPHWKDGQGITVNALNGETVVATATYTLAPGVLKTKTGSSEKIRSDIKSRGTKANPYIIDCENALRQWSYLSTVQTGTLWEGLVKPASPFPTNQIAGHYGRAYYELGADITMGSDPFIPISHVGYGSDGTWGTYSNNFSFQGNFDGKGHKISGLKITWGAGQYKGNKTNIYHGLFGLVGHSTATAKWGDGSTTSNTVIQNLVIENATLTHDISNTTFSYKKNYGHITADYYNNCMVGVLAGIVAANTTVQNIEIRGSKITDEGSSDYSLATMGLFVGGAIGSVQAQYNNENIPTNTVIKNIVVGTDIDLSHAKIQDQAIAQQGAYNVGGIIGRFASTNGNLSATQAVMPKYLLYTGSIKAYSGTDGKRDAMISPVIAATRYSSNSTINLTNISKIWEGNNNGTEQLTVADALYYNFHISDANGEMHLVTEEYPNNVCGNGARAQDTHTDGNETAAGYNAQRYQGVNYNARYIDENTYSGDADGGKRMAVAILNSHDDITMFWEWKSGDKTPHMTETRTEGAYIVRDADTADKYNVVGPAATAGKYYKWYVDGVLQDDEHSSSITISADISDSNIKAEVYDDSSAPDPIATTQYLVIKGEFKVSTSISKDGDTYTVGLNRGGVDLTTNTLGDRIAVTYQWYKGNAVNVNTAELLTGKTAKTITIDKATLGEVNNLFCHVTISTTEADPKVLFTGNISQYVREATVVYLQLQESFKDSKGVTHNKPSTSGDGTVDNPVTSWENAYAKLNDYTVPTKEYVEYHGGTWTSETNFDDETYYLAHKAEYLYDTYKRDGNKRKVKPIEECTNNWDNNVIVLMGLSTDGYFNNGETSQHNIDGARANKPVTITGQWDGGTNYYGYLSNTEGDFSINADHKFENMGIGVQKENTSATASVRYRIYAHRWNVHAGKGLLMGWAAALEWGSDVVPLNEENKKIYKITSADVSTGTPVGQYACDIAIMGGYLNDNTSTNPEMFEYINHGRDDIGQQIKIESGFWGPVCPGNRQTDSGNTITTYYTMGGPDHPAKTTITVDIDRAWNDGTNRNKFNSAMSPATVDVGCILTGNHEGTMYADVTLDILSGKMGRIVNGIKGAQRRQIKNPESFTTDGHYRHTVNYGTKETPSWTKIAAPAPDSYFGRGVLNFDPSRAVNNNNVNKNERVSVIELYCGGLGRGHNDGSYHPEVRSYFYGLSEVNIKGGTFYKTIYGSGAGGVNGIGTDEHHTDDDGIPYWNTTYETADANGKTPHVWYAPYEYIKKIGDASTREGGAYKFVKVKVANNNSEDENLTSDGYVDLEKTRNIINITGGIFGSEKKPVSIYAGGNGEADAALVNPSKTKVGDVKNTYNTPNHQAGNMYGAADGLTTQINISGDAKIYGSIYGGGKGTMRYYRYFLRAPADIVAYTADNQEYTRIWNPKQSSNGDYNTNGGKDWNNIISSRQNADRYLNLGQVYGNSKVSISGNVEIYGNVYGGGEGVKDVPIDQLFSDIDSEFGLENQLTLKNTIIDYPGTATNSKRSAHVEWANDKFVNFPNMGKIFGNAHVEISGNVTIHGNVYGGGQSGSIEGKTDVDINGNVNIFGKVYGAGQGLEVDAAKNYKQIASIIGDATVNLSDNATIWQDMFGGGQNAVVTGNTYFNMNGGHVAANVFGGGEGYIKKDGDGNYVKVNDELVITSADVSGNTNVNINDGDVIWNRTSMPETAFGGMITTHIFTKNNGTAENPIIDTKTYTDAELKALEKTLDQMKTELAGYEYSSSQEENHLVKGEIVYWNPDYPSLPDNTIVDDKKYYNSLFYDETEKTFKIAHNIFGGGYTACNVGSYDNEGKLVANTGLATVSITKGLLDTELVKTKQWKDSFSDDTHPHFYVFGGGLGEHTKVANTDVTVNIEGEYGDFTFEADEPTEQLAKPRKTVSPDPDGKLPVLDNTYGIPGFTVLGVLGGGYAGLVEQNTKVTVDGNTFLRRVYGGGFGIAEVSTSKNNSGQVLGNTDVLVEGAHTYGDVFGGGVGLVSTADHSLEDVARVLGKTSVTIADDARIYGAVYGGGDMACVGVAEGKNKTSGNYSTPVSSASTLDTDTWSYSHSDHQSFVNLLGGNIFGEVYGGGKGVTKFNAEDNTKLNAIDYTKVGRIEGNTLVHIANSVYDEENDTWNIVPEATENAIVPYVWNRIYGGCENGTVDGNTMVHTEGGMLGLNIFGGGYGDVPIDKNQTDISSGTSTASETLDQVLGKIADPSKVTFANILGNTKVVIDGGSWIWNRKADIKGNITTWEDAGKKIGSSLDDFKALVAQIQQATSEEDIKKIDAVKSIDQNFFKLTSRQFSKNHNIFGGGNRACFVGTYPTTVPGASASGGALPATDTGNAEVIINHSPITKIDDGSGNEINMLDHNTVAGLCWYLGINNTSHPQFSVFGAGYGANTKVGNAVVDAQPGVQLNGEGVQITKGKYLNEDSDLAAYFDFENQIAESWQSVTPDEKKLYYGSADGTDGTSNVFLRYRASQLAWSSGAPNFTFMDVHGGGFSGYVVNDAKVTADCQLTARNIFGAGLGAKPCDATANLVDAKAYTFGQVGGDASVFIKSGIVSLNVYGGGAGVESYYVNDEATTKTDFPNVALVKGKTNVDVYGETIKFEDHSQAPSDMLGRRIERTVIYGNVFGGGDVANVGALSTEEGTEKTVTGALEITTANKGDQTYTSTVNVRGASIQSQIYAGGNGRLADQCSITGTLASPIYGYQNLGAVFGNTHLIVADADMTYPYSSETDKNTAPSGVTPHIWNRLYGGCQNGTVYGNTLVEINGGSLGHNIFGGGFGDDGTNFGHSTGDDDDPTQSKNGRLSANITSADVTGHTNIFINGGEMELTSFWHPDTRTWESATIRQGQTYSPQYDADARKFKINHNIYGGGNAACVVEGSTYITMTKGMLKTTTQTVPGQTQDNFFASNEWKEVYQKVGSPHFAVFGGGYGTHTTIALNTHVTTSMNQEEKIQKMLPLTRGEEYKHFLSEMSVMDLVGGGYSGKVTGDTYVNATGGVLARRVFGGGFYNSCKNTNVHIGVIDCHDVFGGGLMGDVIKSTNVTVGTEADNDQNNKDIWIHGNVYGGNDVSGYINIETNSDGYFQENYPNEEDVTSGGTNINIYGGNIDGNVYGAGNGDYLYALDREGHDKVTVNEHYPLNPEDANSPKFDLVYTVPMRETMPSYKAASDAAKIVNINSWRPLTNRVNIKIMGSDAGDHVTIKGDVYGGGNSATVQKVYGHGTTTKTGAVNFNIGKYVNIGRVFMGCNGDKLFTASEDNAFLSDFQKLNNLQLDEEIDWATDPSNHGISTLYLPTENEQRPIIYPHLLDLYFQPVEMDIQADLKWDGKSSDVAQTLSDCTIGTFCCGGNRGNMNVYPATDGVKEGNVLDYLFPEGLTITDKIIGGCNNANYEWFNTEKNAKINHVGGYLLGQGHSPYPFIKLTVKNQFEPKEKDGAYQGGNVFGGCFETGTVRGDITVDVKSDMLAGKKKAKLEKSNELLASDPTYAALNVYGAGYGMESFVYGNTNILFGEGVACIAPTTGDDFNATGTSANFVYGGGQQGNVIGVTNVAIRNGHLYKSVTGGSYSGYVYGSTQTTVGYPTTYTLKSGYAGRYLLKRTDENNLDKKNVDGTPTIKQYINLIPGDIISEGVYEAIVAKYNGEGEEATAITESDKSTYFTSATQAPSDFGLTWDDINIYIDEAVYGGGYSLAQGSSVMANNTTVLKYTDEYNINDTYKSAPLADLTGGNDNGTTVGFGGNTMMLIADATTKLGVTDRDHITISHQEMKEATLADGADLFGYYYKDKTNNYHYISKEGTYIYHTIHENTTLPSDASTTDGKKVYRYDGEGGIFGDGHLSYAEGFRAADLTGYGFADTYINNPKIINTFQRMDILRLTDNCFTLLGARDYATNATNKTPYSISRVGEIQMIANDIVLKPENTLAGKGSDSKRSRNYMGLANNIHYVGAVKSSVPFSEAWRDNVGVLGADANASKSYEDIKQTYIDNYYNSSHPDHDNVYVFQKRNDGTAKNMIGIASGYALKIQNVQEKYNNSTNKIDDEIYYGPIYGVVEMNLIDVRDDEGGGYVYADNVHKRPSAPADPSSARKRAAGAPHAVDFLETTGNFVFPYNPAEGRYIVDDCFSRNYDNLTSEEKKNPDNAKNAEAHYWYVTGYNYYYNVHITGYTYDSSTQAIPFYSDNKDGLTVLAGLKATQEVSIHSWTMRSGHPNNAEHDDYSCDLEVRNYDAYAKDVAGANVKDKYTLNVGAADSLTYDESNGFRAILPMNGGTTTITSAKLPDSLSSDAKITFRLTDEANNTTSDYYNKHLSEPCYATLVLTAPAMKKNESGVLEHEKGYIGISEFYVKNNNGTFSAASASTIQNTKDAYDAYKNTPTYYYVNSVTHEYSPIEDLDLLFTRVQNVDGYVPVHDGVNYKEISINQPGVNNKYYYFAPRIYTYTIYLTIDYVQGPNIDGKITVENCALPGEMIRVNKKNVKIQADESFSADGYYWRIGKREKDSNGNWRFVDTTEWTKTVANNNSAHGYDSYRQTEVSGTGKGFFYGSNYNKTGDYLDIPAYYYMNGYGIQLGVSMNGLDQIFPVKMYDDDKLVIHNYHRMQPSVPNVNLHLAEAVARAKAEKDVTGGLAEPRIYLSDTQDLAGFVAFLDSVGTGKQIINGIETTTGYIKDGKEYIKLGAKQESTSWVRNLCEVPRYGEYAQFVVQNDMEIPAGYDVRKYGNIILKGTVHGEGHVITGLGADKALISENQGNIHNLGMASGKMAAKGCTEGGKYHCCFEYNDGSDQPRKVYRMDGTCTTEYSVDDFRYGKVAYDLNQYYLEARRLLAGNPAPVPDNSLSGNTALTYIHNYWANGDYQYARRADEKTSDITGVTYLRTGTGDDEPNYGSNLTRHNMAHTIDKPRAVGYVAEHEATEADVTAGKAERVGESVPESRTGNYLPLFNSAKQTEGLDLTEQMNDYIYWGQNLQAIPAAYPSTIESLQLSAMTNRVFRAAGYYRDTKAEGYYYNAYNNNGKAMGSYVHNPKTTAIDFTCQADVAAPVYSNGIKDDYLTTGIGTANGGSIYYSPIADNATTFASFNIGNTDVTRNLLVYTSKNDEEQLYDNYDVVNRALAYNENTAESLIKGHQVIIGDSKKEAQYLHLVERAKESAPNNDFCSPIAFDVTNRAWYTRQPANYANDANSAWEGICLPFTVDKTMASINGEITHFYGTAPDNTAPADNFYNLHHEYWLRGLKEVTSDDAKTEGTFLRPGTGLFAPANQATVSSYVYNNNFNNNFFVKTYGGSRNYNSIDNDWYSKSHTYTNYRPLTQGIPYIVSFPGNRFYEFDLSSEFYKVIDSSAKPQTVTFNAYHNNGDVVIPVTTEIKTGVTDYAHIGTYLSMADATYGMNATGTAFDKSVNTVLPFRTYMTASSSSAKTRAGQDDSVIYIAGDATGIEEIIEESFYPEDPNASSSDYLKITSIGNGRISIESTYATTLRVFTAAGQLYRLLDVRPGTETYSGFQTSIYLFGNKKVYIR